MAHMGARTSLSGQFRACLPVMQRAASRCAMKYISALIFALAFAPAAWAGPVEDNVARGREALAARDAVKAMEAFTAALEADPRNVEAAYERGQLLLVIGQPQYAIADFTTAALGDPTFGRAYVGRARAKLMLNNVKSATADFDKAIAVAPKDFEVHVARAAFRARTGDVPGARADLENAKAVADEATARNIDEMLKTLPATP